METNIVICGVGGQGVITAGKLIATAAMLNGKRVVMSEIHGLAQRGGSVSVDVRIGNVLGPIIAGRDADVILAMEPMEGMRNLNRASSEAVILVNTQKMPPISLGIEDRKYPDLEAMIGEMNELHRTVALDALAVARSIGENKTVSTVMVGAVSALSSIQVPVDDFFNAIRQVFPPKLQEVNIRAFKEGRKIALSSLKEVQSPG